jgi:hypothetical protein
MSFKDCGFSAIEHDEARALLWSEGHRFAFERASLEAQFHFNHCPVCGRWVCDDCFSPLGNERYDLCRDCEATQNKNGGQHHGK